MDMLGVEHPSPQSCSGSELALTLTDKLFWVLDHLPKGPTVIQTGHYSLSVHDGQICDVFDERDRGKEAAFPMASLALETWKASCILSQCTFQSHQIKLMTLVNDWQRVQISAASRPEQERKQASLRTEYYRRTTTLPAEYLLWLRPFGLDEEHILKNSSSPWLFSEQQLRNRFNRTLRQMMRDPQQAAELGLSCELTAKNEPIIYGSDEDKQKHQLSYCGHSGCCGEVIQLLRDLQDRGVRNFINLYPAECRLHVGGGSALAQRMFGLSEMTITNIAITPLDNSTVQIFTDQA